MIDRIHIARGKRSTRVAACFLVISLVLVPFLALCGCSVPDGQSSHQDSSASAVDQAASNLAGHEAIRDCYIDFRMEEISDVERPKHSQLDLEILADGIAINGRQLVAVDIRDHTLPHAAGFHQILLLEKSTDGGFTLFEYLGGSDTAFVKAVDLNGDGSDEIYYVTSGMGQGYEDFRFRIDAWQPEWSTIMERSGYDYTGALKNKEMLTHSILPEKVNGYSVILETIDSDLENDGQTRRLLFDGQSYQPEGE